jgi:hypothetical protein
MLHGTLDLMRYLHERSGRPSPLSLRPLRSSYGVWHSARLLQAGSRPVVSAKVHQVLVLSGARNRPGGSSAMRAGATSRH